MFFKLFRRTEEAKATSIKTDEYVELRALYDKLRVRVEGLIIDIELYKQKLKKGKGIPEEEKTSDKNNNPMFLPETDK